MFHTFYSCSTLFPSSSTFFYSYSTLFPSSSTNLQSCSTLSPSCSTLFHSSSTFYQQFDINTKMAAICQSADMFLGSKNLVLTFLYNFGSNIILTIHHEINIF